MFEMIDPSSESEVWASFVPPVPPDDEMLVDADDLIDVDINDLDDDVEDGDGHDGCPDAMLEQQAGIRGKEVRNAFGGGVRTVRRAERVVHVDVVCIGQPLGRLGVVLRLAWIEARVLEHLDALVRDEHA